jgi:hypothetical protein
MDAVTEGWRSYTMRSFIFYTPPQKYYYADQIKENEVGGTSGTHGIREESV